MALKQLYTRFSKRNSALAEGAFFRVVKAYCEGNDFAGTFDLRDHNRGYLSLQWLMLSLAKKLDQNELYDVFFAILIEAYATENEDDIYEDISKYHFGWRYRQQAEEITSKASMSSLREAVKIWEVEREGLRMTIAENITTENLTGPIFNKMPEVDIIVAGRWPEKMVVVVRETKAEVLSPVTAKLIPAIKGIGPWDFKYTPEGFLSLAICQDHVACTRNAIIDWLDGAKKIKDNYD